MRKVVLMLGLVVMLCSGVTPGQVRSAIDDSPLLVSGMRGNESRQHVLFQYIDGAWESISADGFYAGNLAPDGEYLAYLRVPPFLQTLLDGGQDWLLGTTWDITVMNLRDGSWRAVAVQPTTITTTANGYSGGIKRSLPVWSPDGHILAWTEQDYPALNGARLMIHELDSGVSRILDDAVPQMTLSADGLPGLLNWGQMGIVLFTNDPNDNAETLRFYDVPTGTQQVFRLPDAGSEWYPLSGPLWATNTQADADGDVAVVQADNYVWYRADPITGDIAGSGARLELVSAVSPDESLRLVWNIHADASTPVWQLLASDGTELLMWTEPLTSGVGTELTQLGIAPSGQAVAYLEDEALYLWQDGTLVEIAPPAGVQITILYWGPTRWQFGAAYDGVG